MPADALPEPWRTFLRDLDTQLAGPTELHCFGGFVVAQCYGLMRPTAAPVLPTFVQAAHPQPFPSAWGIGRIVQVCRAWNRINATLVSFSCC